MSYLCATELTTLAATSSLYRSAAVVYATRALHMSYVTRTDPFLASRLGAAATTEPSFPGVDSVSFAFMCRHTRSLCSVSTEAPEKLSFDYAAALAHLIRRNSATLQHVQYDVALSTDEVTRAHATCSRLTEFCVPATISSPFPTGAFSLGDAIDRFYRDWRRRAQVLAILSACRALTSIDLPCVLGYTKTYQKKLRTALTGLALRHLRLQHLPLLCVPVLAQAASSLVSLRFHARQDARAFKPLCRSIARHLPHLKCLASLHVSAICVDREALVDPDCVWRSESLTHLQQDLPYDCSSQHWPRFALPALGVYVAQDGAAVTASVLKGATSLTELDQSQDEDGLNNKMAEEEWKRAIEGGAGKLLQTLTLYTFPRSATLVSDMALKWRALRHCDLFLPRAALVAVPLLMRAAAPTLERCVVEESGPYEDAKNVTEASAMDLGTEPLIMERLTKLELAAPLWTASLCRVLQCPRVRKLHVEPRPGARVADLMPHLHACKHLVVYATAAADFSPAAATAAVCGPSPVREPVPPLPAIAHLQLYGATAPMLVPFLSWFPRLGALDVTFQCAAYVDLLQAVRCLSGAFREPLEDEIGLVWIALGVNPLPAWDAAQSVTEWRDVLAQLVHGVPHLNRLRVNLPIERVLVEEIETLLRARNLAT